MSQHAEDRLFAVFIVAVCSAALFVMALAINTAWFDSWKADVEKSSGCHVEADACSGCTPVAPPMRHLNTYWLRCDAARTP